MKNQGNEEKSVRTLRVGEQVRHVLSEILQRGEPLLCYSFRSEAREVLFRHFTNGANSSLPAA